MNPMMAAKAYAAVQGGGMPTGLSGAAQAPGAGDGGFHGVDVLVRGGA